MELNEHKNDIKYGCLMLFISPSDWEQTLSIINKDDIHEEAGGLETEPHATVLYGFHDGANPREVIEKIEHDFRQLRTLKINNISVFENDGKDFDVVKFDVESPILNAANEAVKASFPYTNEYPDYHAHITLAYVKKGTGKKYCMDIDELMRLDKCRLVYSDSDKVKTIKDIIPLRQSAGIVVVRDNTILLVTEKDGSYSLPKGRIEYNENPLECAIRELREETTIVVTKDELINHRKIKTPNGVFYCYTFVDTENIAHAANGEVVDTEFYPIEEALEMIPNWQGFAIAGM